MTTATNTAVSARYQRARRVSHAAVAAAAAALQTNSHDGEIGAPIRSAKYAMMIGDAKNESPEAARTSAPANVAVSMIVPRAEF